MAATVVISESNGAGETVHDNISNLNFGSNDSYEIVVATYPITVGQNSFEKYVRYKCSGTYNKVDNLQVYLDVGSGYKTGEAIKCYLKTSAYSEVAYGTPSASTSSKASETMPVADPGAANLGIDGSLTGSFVTNETDYSDYLILQLQTTGSTPAGDANQKTFYFQYDEQ
jgi:hypothetical protein